MIYPLPFGNSMMTVALKSKVKIRKKKYIFLSYFLFICCRRFIVFLVESESENATWCGVQKEMQIFRRSGREREKQTTLGLNAHQKILLHSFCKSMHCQIIHFRAHLIECWLLTQLLPLFWRERRNGRIFLSTICVRNSPWFVCMPASDSNYLAMHALTALIRLLTLYNSCFKLPITFWPFICLSMLLITLFVLLLTSSLATASAKNHGKVRHQTDIFCFF